MLGTDVHVKYKVRIGKGESVFLMVLTAFNFISLFYSIAVKNILYVLSCAAAICLVFIPIIMESVFRIRISFDLKLTYAVLAISGPVLGNVYKCYYTVPHWDKIMHGLSGYSFAALGYCLPALMERSRKEISKLTKAVFAVCFSLAIAALWEIYEYAGDMLFQMDMQNDTVIHDISSYMLGTETGTIGSISDIATVTVNGHALPYQGYIDIGLIDTMNDMLICLAGTIAFVAFAYTRKKNTEFSSIKILR